MRTVILTAKTRGTHVFYNAFASPTIGTHVYFTTLSRHNPLHLDVDPPRVEVSKRPEQGNRFMCVFHVFYNVFRDRHAKKLIKQLFFMHPRVLGLSGGLLGPSGGFLGPSGGLLSMGLAEPSWASWMPSGVSGASWGFLEASWGPSRASGSLLGPPGAFWWLPGAF